jgi:hypothetical protein
VCLAHISANATSKGFKEGLPTHELNPIDGSITPVQPYTPTSSNSSRARRQLPAVISSASTSFVGITFSYSVTVTQCRPVFTVRVALNGFGTSVVETFAGQFGPYEIPFLNTGTLVRLLIPGGGAIIAEILDAVGFNGYAAFTARIAHNGASLELNMILGLCYELEEHSVAWWVAWWFDVAYSACCCEWQFLTINSRIGLGALGFTDPCLTTTPASALTTSTPPSSPPSPPPSGGAGAGTCTGQFLPVTMCPYTTAAEVAALPTCQAAAYNNYCEADGECGTSNTIDNCPGAYDVYMKRAPGYYDCTSPSDCASGNYCDTNGECWNCPICWLYDDSITGSCSPQCTQTTAAPTTVWRCANHTQCGYPSSGLFCSASGPCQVCRQCTASVAIGGSCPVNCPATSPPPPPPPPPPCVDAATNATGFTISGQPASCVRLASYCNDRQFGSSIQAVCPVSCRMCAPSVHDCCAAVQLQVTDTNGYYATAGVYARTTVMAAGHYVWERVTTTSSSLSSYIFFDSNGYWVVGDNYSQPVGWFCSAFPDALCPATPNQTWLYANSGGWLSANSTVSCITMPVEGIATCGNTYTGTTAVGGTEYVSYSAGPEVWWAFTVPASATGTYVFDTCGSSFDTYAYIYTRTASNTLGTAVSSCDDCGPCGNTAVLTVPSLPHLPPFLTHSPLE